MDEVKKSLLEAEKLVVKIKKKVRRQDLDYTIQYVMDSTNPGVLKYGLIITPINEATGPMKFVASTGKELLEKLKYRLDNGLDQVEMQKDFHKFTIANIKKTIQYHEEQLKVLEQQEQEEEQE